MAEALEWLQYVLAPQVINGASLGVAVVLMALGLTIIFGLLIIGFLVFEPQGLAEVWRRIRRFFHLWPFRN